MVKKIDRPVLITEFGYDAFNNKTQKEDEETQAKIIIKLWNDIIVIHIWAGLIC